MPAETDSLTFDALVTETGSAWLIEIDDKHYWLPKSQCEIDEQRKTIEVPVWLLEQKGLA